MLECWGREREGRGWADRGFKRYIRGNHSNTRRLYLTGASAAVLTALWATSAAAQTWTGATSNDWTTGSNWSTGTVPAGTTANISTSSPNPTVLGVSGPATGATGAITVGGTAGTGNLTVQNGSTLTSTGGLDQIGLGTAATGTVTVTGAGSQWIVSGTQPIFVGLAGTGTLNIQNGGQVIAQKGTQLGRSASGSGTLNISSGGTLQTTSLIGGAGAAQANFDDATIRALASSPAFISALTVSQLNIAAGGLTIDTNGFSIGAPGFSGVGGLTTAGTGTLTLNGVSTYTGQTVIGSGSTLALTTAASIAASSRVVDNGTFNISGLTGSGTSVQRLAGSGEVALGTKTLTITNANDTFAGTFLGSGGLTLASGTEILTGDSSSGFTGTTNVNGATLAGTATLASLNVNNGSTLSPGLPGTVGGRFNVDGNLTFASGSTYAVTIAPGAGNNSATAVTGTATINGSTVVVTPQLGRYNNTVYQILTTPAPGDLVGIFASLSTRCTLAGTMTLDYTTNPGDVDLDVNGACLMPQQGPGGNQNQNNVLNGMNAALIAGSSPPQQFQNLLGLSGAAYLSALTQLSGEPATDAEKGAFQQMSQFVDIMLDPFVYGSGNGTGGGGANGFAPEQDSTLPPEIAAAYAAVLKVAPKPQSFDRRWSAWGASFGGTSFTDGNAAIGSNNVKASDYGFAAGMDYHVTPDTLFGFGLAGGGTNWGLAQGLGSGRSDSLQAGLYGKTHAGPAYLFGALAFANHWFTTDRTALGDQLRASFTGQSYAGRIETGYRFGLPASTGLIAGVTPYAAVLAQYFHTPSYSEADLTGGGFGLSYNAMNATDTRSELGARFDDLTILGGMPLMLRGRLAWAHDWVTNPSLGAAFQTLPGSNFIVNGAAPLKNSALTTAAAELHMTTNWTLVGKFDGQFGSGSQIYAGTGTLRYTW